MQLLGLGVARMVRKLTVASVLFTISLIGASIPALAGETHRTTVTLRLTGSLIATGEVRAADGTNACEAHREVVIQKRGSGGGWQTVESKDSRPSGSYRISIPDENGDYRALVRKLELGPTRGTCTRDISPVEAHGDGGDDSNCTDGYSPCLVYHGGADYDCAGGSGDGPYYTEPGVTYQVTGSDPYGLDGDNDGYGCE